AARPARDRLFVCVLFIEASPWGLIQRGVACGAGTVFRYATMASICAGSNVCLKPGMRGVPFVMVSRTTSARPPADSFDSVGPNVLAVICGLRWHTPHDWVKRVCPSR